MLKRQDFKIESGEIIEQDKLPFWLNCTISVFVHNTTTCSWPQCIPKKGCLPSGSKLYILTILGSWSDTQLGFICFQSIFL